MVGMNLTARADFESYQDVQRALLKQQQHLQQLHQHQHTQHPPPNAAHLTGPFHRDSAGGPPAAGGAGSGVAGPLAGESPPSAPPHFMVRQTSTASTGVEALLNSSVVWAAPPTNRWGSQYARPSFSAAHYGALLGLHPTVRAWTWGRGPAKASMCASLA